MKYEGVGLLPLSCLSIQVFLVESEASTVSVALSSLQGLKNKNLMAEEIYIGITHKWRVQWHQSALLQYICIYMTGKECTHIQELYFIS